MLDKSDVSVKATPKMLFVNFTFWNTWEIKYVSMTKQDNIVLQHTIFQYKEIWRKGKEF